MTEALAGGAMWVVSVAGYMVLAWIVDRSFDRREPLSGGSLYILLMLHVVAFLTSGTLFIVSLFRIVQA